MTDKTTRLLIAFHAHKKESRGFIAEMLEPLEGSGLIAPHVRAVMNVIGWGHDVYEVEDDVAREYGEFLDKANCRATDRMSEPERTAYWLLADAWHGAWGEDEAAWDVLKHSNAKRVRAAAALYLVEGRCVMKSWEADGLLDGGNADWRMRWALAGVASMDGYMGETDERVAERMFRRCNPPASLLAAWLGNPNASDGFRMLVTRLALRKGLADRLPDGVFRDERLLGVFGGLMGKVDDRRFGMMVEAHGAQEVALLCAGTPLSDARLRVLWDANPAAVRWLAFDWLEERRKADARARAVFAEPDGVMARRLLVEAGV